MTTPASGSAADAELLAQLPDPLPEADTTGCHTSPEDLFIDHATSTYVLADAVEFGERRIVAPEDSYWEWPALIRDVQLVEPELLHGNTLPESIVIQEGVDFGDGFVRFGEDIDVAEELSPVLVLLNVAADDDGQFRGRLNRVAGFDPSQELRFSNCEASWLRDANAVAAELDRTDTFAVLTEWAAAVGTQDETPFTDAAFTAAHPDVGGQREADFEAADPRVRSVHPIDLPPSLQGTFEVRVIWLDLEGAADGDVFYVRTNTGVSAGITAGAMDPTFPMPVFIFPEDDRIEVVRSTFQPVPDDPVIASLPAADLTGGVVVTGLIDAPVVELLDQHSAAERHGFAENEYSRLQDFVTS